MATLKALSTLIVSGGVVHSGSVFHCPEALASSLIERNFAFEIKEAEDGETVESSPQTTEEVDEVEQMREEYAAKTVPELIDLARANGIDVSSLSRKSEYIDALIKYELGE
jgi:hypothetical protein|nr:MAG TPA: hypothetical protein [Caudoviricetes sp.]